jgi:hypothetical protein
VFSGGDGEGLGFRLDSVASLADNRLLGDDVAVVMERMAPYSSAGGYPELLILKTEPGLQPITEQRHGQQSFSQVELVIFF